VSSLWKGSKVAFRFVCLAVAVALAAAAGPARADQWARAAQLGDVVYLPIIQGTPRIERYDLASGSWLAPLPTDALGRAVAVAPGSIYVQGETTLRRLTLSGVEVWSVPSRADDVVVDPAGWVFTLDPARNLLTVFAATDGHVVDTLDFAEPDEPYTYLVRGLSIAPGIRRLYVQRHTVPGVRIASVPYGASGALGDVLLSEGMSSSGGSRTWVFPGEDRVAGEQGQVLDAETLEWRDSLLGGRDDIVFDGPSALVVSYSSLTRFSPDLEPVGQHHLPFEPDAMFVRGSTLFAFANRFTFPQTEIADVAAVPIGSIALPPLPTPADPGASTDPPDAFAIDSAGTISFYRPASPGPSVYRLSIPDDRFLPSVALREPSTRVECPALGGLLFGDRAGQLRRLPYGATSDEHWRNLPSEAVALACTSRHVVAALRTELDGSRGSALTTFTPEGEIADSIAIPRIIFSAHATWSEPRGRLYLAHDSNYPSAYSVTAYPIGEDGAIGAASATADGFDRPERVLGTDGPFAVSRSRFFDPESLTSGAYLDGALGATWQHGLLFLLQRESFDVRLTVWNAARQRTQSTRLPAFALFGFEGSLRAAFLESGRLTVREIAADDIDGDGHPTGEDAFPGDPDEWSDRDGDGVGDRGDVFPDDPSESADQDGDGVGDHSDVFPDDSTEWSDRDHDYRGDNSDVFPDDGTEWEDSDEDGYGDNGDWAPLDPTEWLDSDGDDYGDNTDLFPQDPVDHADFDGDGIGDRRDPFPLGDPTLGLVDLVGKERVTFARLGSSSRQHPGGSLGILPNGDFGLCALQTGCLFGRVLSADDKGRRFELEVDPTFVPEIEPALEEGLAQSLSRAFRRNVTLDLVPRPEATRILLKLDRSGKRGTFKAKWVFDAHLANVPGPYRNLRFALTWKFAPARVVHP
jgi:hypothetical protein